MPNSRTLVATEQDTAGWSRKVVSPTYPAPVTGAGTAGSPSTAVQSVQGLDYVSSLTITRPANTTAYAAGDVIGIEGGAGAAGSAIHTLATIGPAGGHIFITDVQLETDVTSVPSGMTTFRLHLYDAAPDAILDNAAFDLASAGDRGKYLGYVELVAPVDVGSTLFSTNPAVNKKVKLASTATSIYGVLQTIGAYTPTSGAVKRLAVHAVAL